MKTNWFLFYQEFCDDYESFLQCLSVIFVNRDSIYLCDFLKLLKLGLMCKDCECDYSECECDKCEFCYGPICICNFEDRREFIYKWIIRNVNKQIIKELIIYIEIDTKDFKIFGPELQNLNYYLNKLKKYV